MLNFFKLYFFLEKNKKTVIINKINDLPTTNNLNYSKEPENVCVRQNFELLKFRQFWVTNFMTLVVHKTVKGL